MSRVCISVESEQGQRSLACFQPRTCDSFPPRPYSVGLESYLIQFSFCSSHSGTSIARCPGILVISNFADILWGSSGRNTHCGHCLHPQFGIQKDLGAPELLRKPQASQNCNRHSHQDRLQALLSLNNLPGQPVPILAQGTVL